jgi:hypothetical protein
MDPDPTPGCMQRFDAYTHRFATVDPYHMRWFYAMVVLLIVAIVLVAVQNGLWVSVLIAAGVCFLVQYLWRGEY